MTAQLLGLRAFLKAIEEGDFASVDIPAFRKKFESGGYKYGDHLQYALHKFCRQSKKDEVELAVISLSRLCFSKESAFVFSNMGRFLGSLFHITSYFLKRHNYSIALEISNCIDVKRTEIEERALESADIRYFLYSLHCMFVLAAQGIAANVKDSGGNKEMQLSYELAEMSLKFLQLMKCNQVETGEKVLRNFKSYFNSLKFHDKKMVNALYRGLEDVLHHILPNYRHNDFLHYYMVRLDQVENENKMDYNDLGKHFERQLRLISIFVNDSKTLKLWEGLLCGEALDGEHLANFTSNAAVIVANEQSYMNSLILSIYFNHATQFWIKNCTNKWVEIFSSKMVQKLYAEVFLPMRDIVRNITEVWTVPDFGMDICFTDFYHISVLQILNLIRLCLKFGVPNCLDLVAISREIFGDVRKRLSELKTPCCLAMKKQHWNSLVVHYTNTVEGLLRHADSEGVWTFMKDCCEELLREILSTESVLPYEWKRVKILFQRWHFACLKLKDFDEALFISAFFAISYPSEEEEGVSMWIQTKKYLSSDFRQSLTLREVVEKQGIRMKWMNTKCTPFSRDLRRLLMKELTAYRSFLAFNWNASESVVKAMAKVWEALQKSDLDLCDRATALNDVMVAAITSGDPKSIEKYRKECEDVVAELLRCRNNENKCRRLLHAGNLKHVLFLCRLKGIQDAEDEISASKSILECLRKEEEVKVKFGEDVDLNLTCNVMPSTNHFTVSFEENYVASLGETWSLWEEAAERVGPTSLEPHEFSAWLHSIKQISQMYYLIGHVRQSLLSWMMCYNVAKVCDDRSCVLLALSEIIPECVNLEKTRLLKEAEDIAEKLVREESGEKDALIPYWLAVAFNCLKNRNGRGCFNYLEKVKEVMSNMKEGTKSLVYQARYWCLVSKFLCLYHDEMDKFEKKAGTELMHIVIRAFECAKYAVKNGPGRSLASAEYLDVLLTVMEVSLWAYNFCSAYNHAAHMRQFLDDLYQMFQKLVLPTRTAFVLSLLAEVDIMCEKVEDANTKLYSLKRILGSSYCPSIEEKHDPRKKSDTLKVPKYDEDGRESPRALSPARFLDVHDFAKERDPSPLRYVLKEVDLMERLPHTGRCRCYTCRSLIIKLLYVNALLLEAQVNHLNGYIKKSCVYYKEAYESRRKLESYQLRLNEKMAEACGDFEGLIDFQGDLVRMNSVKFLMHYSRFILATVKGEKMEDVDKMIKMIDKTMLSLSFQEKLFLPKIVELKLVAFTIKDVMDTEQENENKAPMRVIRSPNRYPMKTPVTTRGRGRNPAPMKYIPPKGIQSPNNFISKPKGRKVFSDDEDKAPDEGKKTSSKKSNRRKVDGSKRTGRKKAALKMIDASLLS